MPACVIGELAIERVGILGSRPVEASVRANFVRPGRYADQVALIAFAEELADFPKGIRSNECLSQRCNRPMTFRPPTEK